VTDQLPEVRRADCGHGFLPINTAPAARVQNGIHEQPVYLCEDCRARLQVPKVERKVVEPARAEPSPPSERAVLKTTQEAERVTDPDKARALGRAAAHHGLSRTLPGHIRHPREAAGRAWFAGYDEVKGVEKADG
jgi:hypothetical protein